MGVICPDVEPPGGLICPRTEAPRLCIQRRKKKLSWVKKKFPKQKIVISYHNFSETPTDLQGILDKMGQADFYKLACRANSSLDSLRMLKMVSEKVIGIVLYLY